MSEIVPAVRVFVALGSNLGDRQAHILEALNDIQLLELCKNLKASSLYQTDPMGPQDQPDYLNAVCSFDYTGTARQLLIDLQAIERQHGRVKSTQRWTARPLDLDILLFGEQQIDEPDLQVPHIGIAQRSFVLWPMTELDPHVHVPGLGAVSQLCDGCQQFGIEKYNGVAK